MQQNIEFERCVDFLVRMIDKISTAKKSSGSWRKKNRIRKKKKRQFPEIQNVNQTVAFLRNYSAALSFTSASIICSSRSISGNTTFLPLE